MKGLLQIPLRHFHSDPQANGSEESSTARPTAAVTQSNHPKAKNSSKSSPTSKSELSTALHDAAGIQSGRSRNSNTQRNEQESSSRSGCPPSPRRSPLRHRERTSTRPARSGRSPRGSSPHRERSAQGPATTTAGPGMKGTTKMREYLNTGAVIFMSWLLF